MGHAGGKFGTDESLFGQVKREDRVDAVDHEVRAVSSGSLDCYTLRPDGMECIL